MSKPRFSDDILAALREGRFLRVRAGKGAHRFTGI
jgi:hypothetical protein